MNRRFLNRRSFSRIIGMFLCVSLFACICSSSVLASAEDGDSAERDFIIIAEHNAETGQTTYETIDLRPLPAERRECRSRSDLPRLFSRAAGFRRGRIAAFRKPRSFDFCFLIRSISCFAQSSSMLTPGKRNTATRPERLAAKHVSVFALRIRPQGFFYAWLSAIKPPPRRTFSTPSTSA